MNDMDVFDEWRELFNKYRRDGVLPKRERKRFRELTVLVRKQGLMGDEDESAIKNLTNDLP